MCTILSATVTGRCINANIRNESAALRLAACTATPSTLRVASRAQMSSSMSEDSASLDVTDEDLAQVERLQRAVEKRPGDYAAHADVRMFVVCGCWSSPRLRSHTWSSLLLHSGAVACEAGCTMRAWPWRPASRSASRRGVSGLKTRFRPLAGESNTSCPTPPRVAC